MFLLWKVILGIFVVYFAFFPAELIFWISLYIIYFVFLVIFWIITIIKNIRDNKKDKIEIRNKGYDKEIKKLQDYYEYVKKDLPEKQNQLYAVMDELDKIYDELKLHQFYRNIYCMIMFNNYLELGRADDLTRCKDLYDLDLKIKENYDSLHTEMINEISSVKKEIEKARRAAEVSSSYAAEAMNNSIKAKSSSNVASFLGFWNLFK